MSTNSSHHRRSIRLEGYDYSQPGAYFVTLVTHQREALFGEVAAGDMRLTAAGEVVREIWGTLPNRYPQIELDEWAIMPNHFHGILWIIPESNVGAIHELPLQELPLQELPYRNCPYKCPTNADLAVEGCYSPWSSVISK